MGCRPAGRPNFAWCHGQRARLVQVAPGWSLMRFGGRQATAPPPAFRECDMYRLGSKLPVNPAPPLVGGLASGVFNPVSVTVARLPAHYIEIIVVVKHLCSSPSVLRFLSKWLRGTRPVCTTNQ